MKRWSWQWLAILGLTFILYSFITWYTKTNDWVDDVPWTNNGWKPLVEDCRLNTGGA